jgi:putative ABC transport system ATP-binding protein
LSGEGLVVDARGVTKTFGAAGTAYQALRGVDLTVARGEVVLLWGPSGSGKTTLLSIVGGTLRATGGQVTVLGRELGGLSEAGLARFRAAHVGFVFQAHNLLAALDARDNVATMLELRGASRRQALREADALLDDVGLGGRGSALPAELSGGMRQRVAVARALAGSPELLLADEPTAALDAHNGLAVAELLARLARQRGRTVVIVTHDPRITHVGDRRVSLEDGRVTGVAPIARPGAPQEASP